MVGEVKRGNKMSQLRNKSRQSPVTNLRVISGRFRGTQLKTPLSHTTHPMGAREKLALFNMVAVTELKVLDAYAGTGALGIEALSRDAAEVAFVEANRAVGKVLQENLAVIGVDSVIYFEKVENFAKRAEYQEYFDVILADPPYDKIDISEIEKLAELIKTGGTLALSSPANQAVIELAGMRVSSTHTYARARLTVYRKD